MEQATTSSFEGHRKLERLVGTWLGHERTHPSPWEPEAGERTSHVANRLVLDGLAVVQEYEQQRGDVVVFRGHAVFRYDREDGVYRYHWFDSLSPKPTEFSGTFEGDTLVLTSAGAEGHVRATWRFEGDRSYAYAMEVSGDGTTWSPFMEGRYERVGS